MHQFIKVAMSGLLLLVFSGFIGAVHAQVFQIKPYKDKIFKYRKLIESHDGGGYVRAPYEPLRDINARDEVPVRKVKTYYTSRAPRRHEQDLAFQANGRTVTHFAVGALEGNANMSVIFLHGRDGSRHLGFDDERFGGNFNRVKNLMFRNGGIYISADFSDFKEDGRQDVAAILAKYRKLTKGPMVVACGSMGSHICWRLVNNKSSRKLVDGLVIMGGFPNGDFLESQQRKQGKPIPVYIAHGSIDAVYKWKDQLAFYQILRHSRPNYPVRYVVFDGGKHGTPVRMIDWRLALNWIAQNQN